MPPEDRTASTIEQLAMEAGTKVMAETGRGVLDRAQVAGRALLLFWQAVGHLGEVGRSLPMLKRQIDSAGFGSILVLALIAGLTGMIMAVQTGVALQDYGATDRLGGLIALTFCRELGPIWAAVIILARVGAAMAAELGTMAVNEEIDALRAMSIDPVRYLIMPRILALAIILPMLSAIADFVGMMGGALISKATFGISLNAFFDSAKDNLTFLDVSSGLFKSIIFSLLIGTIACDQGINTSDGAEGVGRSTTKTVVLSIIFVLLMDLFLTSFIQLVIKRMIA
jgi:phospholipid/cholesterol/gamma-HCH transport system permease protein